MTITRKTEQKPRTTKKKSGLDVEELDPLISFGNVKWLIWKTI